MKKSFKQIFFLVAVVVTVIMCMVLSVGALDATGKCGDNVTYVYNSTTKELVISGSGKMSDYEYGYNSPFYGSDVKSIVIKDGVTSIGEIAFCDCESVTSVTIPKSVKSIGARAFLECESLKSITIPDSVISIGERAFDWCTSLAKITIPNSVTEIGEFAFGCCESLESITLPKSLKSLGVAAFSSSGIKSITIPDGVTSISVGVFSECANLTSVTIPNSVTSIGLGAFSYCTSLKSITIPKSVTSIGDTAFYGCTSLDKITIPDTVTHIGNAAFKETAYYEDESNWETDEEGVDAEYVLYLNKYFLDAPLKSGSCSIKKGTLLIADGAFESCSRLNSVTIPDSVKSIGNMAFSGCSSLKSITIPNSVENIGIYAFGDCSKLKSIKISASVTSIGERAFLGCESLENITVDKNNKKYSSDSYGGLFNKNKTELLCYPLGNTKTSYTIPNSVTSIGDRAFYSCRNLTSVTIPNSVTSIGENAFCDCASLTGITIPNSVKNIGAGAFYGCESLKSVTISNSITSINDGVFDNCTSLTSVTIPNSVISIGESAFYGCTSLKSITIPNSVKNIGTGAFWECRNLGNITLPNSITNIGRVVFDGTAYYKNESNWEDGVLYIGKYIFSTDEDMSGSYSIKEGTLVLADGAFSATRITSITIPDSVINMGESTFYNCRKLKNVKIPGSITKINDSTFEACVKLKSVIIGKGVEEIGDKAFLGCKNITDVHIPKNVNVIRERAFLGCANIKNMYYEGSKKQWGLIAKYKNWNGGTSIDDSNINYDTYCPHVNCKTTVTKATLKKNGKKLTKCTLCGDVVSSSVIYYPKTVKLTETTYTYSSKNKTPGVIVEDSKGKVLKKNTDYTVKYESERKAPGEYTVTITFRGNYEGAKKINYTIKPRATSKVTASQTITTITLEWNKVTGAEGYRVYKYNTKTKKYEKLKDVTDTSLKISKLKSGTKYKYKVRAYLKDNGVIWGAYSSEFETATKCKAPKIRKIEAKKGKAIYTWSDVSGESGYLVYYSNKKDGEYKKAATYGVNVVKGSKSSLKSGNTYYFKVRAYKKTASGKIYSYWSSVKSVKVK